MSKHQQNKETQTNKKPSPPQAAENKNQGPAEKILARSITQAGDIPSQVAMLKRLSPAQQQTLVQAISSKQGNGHVQRLMKAYTANTTPTPHRPPAPTLQAKLTVNPPDDIYEQEADKVADHVMRMPASPTPPPPEDPGGEPPPAATAGRTQPISPSLASEARSAGGATTLQAKFDGVGPVDSNVETHIEQMRGGGQPLPTEERSFFEERMGADFSNARIHTDPNAIQAARDLNARAFTVGSNIAFNAGEYAPGTTAGRTLLAHELTHVAQQGGAVQCKQKEPDRPSEQPQEEPLSTTFGQVAQTKLADPGQAFPLEGPVSEAKTPSEIDDDDGEIEGEVDEYYNDSDSDDKTPEAPSFLATPVRTPEAAVLLVEKDTTDLPEPALNKSSTGLVGDEKTETGKDHQAAEETSPGIEDDIAFLGSAGGKPLPIQRLVLTADNSIASAGENASTDIQTVANTTDEVRAGGDHDLREAETEAAALTAAVGDSSLLKGAVKGASSIIDTGKVVLPDIETAAKAVKTNFNTTAKNQTTTLQEKLASARRLVQAKAEVTQKNIEAGCDVAIYSILGSSQVTQDKINAAYKDVLTFVNRWEKEDGPAKMKKSYRGVKSLYRETASEVRKEVTAAGKKKAKEYLDPTNELGKSLTKQERKRYAKAARLVAKQFCKVSDESILKTEYGKAMVLKKQDLAAIPQIAENTRKGFMKFHKDALVSLSDNETKAIAEAKDSKENHLAAAETTRKIILKAIDQYEIKQTGQIGAVERRQRAAVNQTAARAVTQIQKNVSQEAKALLAAVKLALEQNKIKGDYSSGEDESQTGALAQIEQGIAQTQDTIRSASGVARRGLAGAEANSPLTKMEGVATVGDDIIKTISDPFDSFFSEAILSFKRTADSYEKYTKDFALQQEQDFQRKLLNVRVNTLDRYTDFIQPIYSTNNIKAGIIGMIPTDILSPENIKSAAADIQPGWKSVAKFVGKAALTVLVVGAVLVAAVVLTPVVAGALVAAGLSVAAAGTAAAIGVNVLAGVLTGVTLSLVDSAVDKKKIEWKSVAVSGLIGGLGAGVGMVAGKFLTPLLADKIAPLFSAISVLTSKFGAAAIKEVVKFGVDLVTDIGFNMAIELATVRKVTPVSIGVAFLIAILTRFGAGGLSKGLRSLLHKGEVPGDGGAPPDAPSGPTTDATPPTPGETDAPSRGAPLETIRSDEDIIVTDETQVVPSDTKVIDRIRRILHPNDSHGQRVESFFVRNMRGNIRAVFDSKNQILGFMTTSEVKGMKPLNVRITLMEGVSREKALKAFNLLIEDAVKTSRQKGLDGRVIITAPESSTIYRICTELGLPSTPTTNMFQRDFYYNMQPPEATPAPVKEVERPVEKEPESVDSKKKITDVTQQPIYGKLNSTQKGTLEDIFARPVKSTIPWTNIENLLDACGAFVMAGEGVNVRITLVNSTTNKSHTVNFHRPHGPKGPYADAGMVRKVCDFLIRTGVIK